MGAVDKSTDTNEDWFPTYEANVYELSQCYDGVFRYQVITPECKLLKVCPIYKKDEKGKKKRNETFLDHKDLRKVDEFLMSRSNHDDYTYGGINTSHWWVRFLCYNRETLEDSIIDTEYRFGIKIRVKGEIDFIRGELCLHRKDCI